MASGSITSWQKDGENVVTVSDFLFLGSKINADSDDSIDINIIDSESEEDYDIEEKISEDESTNTTKKELVDKPRGTC